MEGGAYSRGGGGANSRIYGIYEETSAIVAVYIFSLTYTFFINKPSCLIRVNSKYLKKLVNFLKLVKLSN